MTCRVLFQNRVQPEPGASAVALSEWVRHVHLHILGNDLVKGRLRHGPDVLQSCLQIEDGRKAEIALCNVDRAYLPRKVVYPIKEVFVDLRKAPKSSHSKCPVGPSQTIPAPALRSVLPLCKPLRNR